ncbi:hypothetical protein MOE47_19145 [Bacillus atrophaeus]|uniref:hypothetical protein n=1 Tax=Bacillus atrophaeus TaxID=1452 RepID=UPI00228164B8|nr:hypothetical protein [Bacillus atrophaeus]MCY8466771.1 hypothetical protein [Bacillus atrophaeus]MCY8479719.1 hypothetical protein [Bacillus atrophaeus]MCY8914489.1 hypothetical protein [Bacillus atrophaeus]MCY9116469.1 hypothetical protein [Bacillus atrophaeus]MEC0927522.1 hypothetical protein [Bacillus atrophaeus]
MKINFRHFPHPVLMDQSDDYVDSYFAIKQFECAPGKDAFEFNVSFELYDCYLQELIKNHIAEYAVHLECAPTNYRVIKNSFKPDISFSIPADLVEREIIASTLIIASEKISGYSNPNFHEDFAEETFEIQAKDILAAGPRKTVELEKKSPQQVGSIFQLKRNNASAAPALAAFFEHNKIIVELSAENYKNYNFMKKDKSLEPLFHSLLAMPVLVSAIEYLKQDENLAGAENYSWFRTVKKKLELLGEDIYDPGSLDSLLTAQKLLETPLTKSLRNLAESTNEDDEEEY